MLLLFIYSNSSFSNSLIHCWNDDQMRSSLHKDSRDRWQLWYTGRGKDSECQGAWIMLLCWTSSGRQRLFHQYFHKLISLKRFKSLIRKGRYSNMYHINMKLSALTKYREGKLDSEDIRKYHFVSKNWIKV